MKLIVSILIYLSAGFAEAQDNSKKTFVSSGVNAAAYTNISIDKGTVDNRDFSNLRLLFGFQLLRVWDYASLSVGYGKVGFFDAVHEWGDEPGSFQLNYQGPTVGLVIIPNWYVSLEAIHWLSPKGQGVHDLQNSAFDDQLKYDYDVSETTFYLGFRVWDNLKVILGTGQRKLKGTVKGVRNGAVSTEVAAAAEVDNSDSFFLIGIQGTQIMNF